MPAFDVAFVHIEGRNFILVPVHPRFGMTSADAMRSFVIRVRKLAATAGLVGEVIPVWDDGDGGLLAFARPSVLPRLARLSWERVRRHVNVRLHVGTPIVEVRGERTAEGQVAAVLAS